MLRPFLSDDDPRTLREFVRDGFSGADENPDADPEATTDIVLRALEQGLATGAVTLVVAAPTIPQGVQRVLEYLNAQGLRLFGVEVSYFKGPAEAFVPRVVVRPSAADPATTPVGGAPPTDAETLLPHVPEQFHEQVRAFLDRAHQCGGEVQWTNYGLRMRATGSKKVLITLDNAHVYVALVRSRSFSAEPFDVARAALDNTGVGSAKKEWYSAAWSKLSSNQLLRIF